MSDRLKILPVILCGGAGHRLWPLSRPDFPKQFHKLLNDKTLLVNTLERLKPVKNLDYLPSRIIGAEQFRATILEQTILSGVETEQIMLEPCMRDTCAAIASSIADIAHHNREQIVLVLPSDHHIQDVIGFNRTIEQAARTVMVSGGIMTIGIEPEYPETQYGYIERVEGEGPIFDVERFVEKPDLKVAETYLALGRYVWNAGIFMFKVADMVAEFENQQTKIWQLAQKASSNAIKRDKFCYLDKDAFMLCEKQSIDYGIMENAKNIHMIYASFDWSDIGSWRKLHEIAEKDQLGNIRSGKVISLDSHNNYIRAEDRLVAIGGVDDLIVVSEFDALLITHRDKSYLVKELSHLAAKANWPPVKTHHSGRRLPDCGEIYVWLFDIALPYWANNGIDYQCRGVHEALSYQGDPVDLGFKRLRVLARQIYCFAQAKFYGWQGQSDKILRHCFDTLVETAWREKGGWIARYNLDGSVKDDQPDFYDQAFVLLACAVLYRATGWDEARTWSEKTQNYLDVELSDKHHGGYFESLEGKKIRRANPHMHYLESQLIWYEITAEQIYLDRALKIINLFKNKFFDHKNWRLHEFMTTDFTPLTDDINKVEPGHHYEWVWLLLKYVEVSGDHSLYDYARKLYATALSFGHMSATDSVADHMDANGNNLSATARLWPQTEALKAALLMKKHNLPHDENLVLRMLDQIYNRYLTTPQAGGWFDKIDHNGRVVSSDIQASLFYHIFCAFAEYLEVNSMISGDMISHNRAI